MPEFDIEQPGEVKQEEGNIGEEDMDMDMDCDDDDIYPSSPQEEYYTEQETESDSDMSETKTDEAKDQRCINLFLHNTFDSNNVGAQAMYTTLTDICHVLCI